MICANCLKERAKGSYYGFHYGFVSKEKNEAEKVVTGSDQVWICRICVTRRLILTWIVGALLFVGLILKLQDDYLIAQIQFFITPRIRQLFGVNIGFPLARFAYDAIPVIMIVWAIGGVFGAYLLWRGIKEYGTVGETIAIKISKEQYSHSKAFRINRQDQNMVLTGESNMEATQMDSGPTKIKTVYSFVAATIMLDLSTPMGKAMVEQIFPFACQNLRKDKPEFERLYSQVERENTPHVQGTGMAASSGDFAGAFLAWLKSKGMNITDDESKKKMSVFGGDAQNPQDGSAFAWCVFLHFDIEE